MRYLESVVTLSLDERTFEWNTTILDEDIVDRDDHPTVTDSRPFRVEQTAV